MVVKGLHLTLTVHSLRNLSAGIFQPPNAESNKVNKALSSYARTWED